MTMGKKVPRKDQEKNMSFLGKGAFMSTYRKTTIGELHHRHIVYYCSLEVTDEVVVIVMELAEGGSLAGFIKECALGVF